MTSRLAVLLLLTACSTSGSAISPEPVSSSSGDLPADAGKTPTPSPTTGGPGDEAPDVATEECSVVEEAAPHTRYAVHSYSGKSAVDLAIVRAIIHVPAAQRPTVDGVSYDRRQVEVTLADGKAFVRCGNDSFMDAESVTFVLPR